MRLRWPIAVALAIPLLLGGCTVPADGYVGIGRAPTGRSGCTYGPATTPWTEQRSTGRTTRTAVKAHQRLLRDGRSRDNLIRSGHPGRSWVQEPTV